VPAIVAWQIGITSCSSASKTLFLSASIPHPVQFSLQTSPHSGSPSIADAHMVSKNIPIEILTSAHSNQSITIRQRRKDAHSAAISFYSITQFPPSSLPPSVLGAGSLSRGHSAMRGTSLESQTHSFEFSNCARTAMMSSLLDNPLAYSLFPRKVKYNSLCACREGKREIVVLVNGVVNSAMRLCFMLAASEGQWR
jgi:hypothetical protein